ncbi:MULTISPECIES: ThiF family adenylyltransferase [Spirulina sp. CCY15215]|uniref:HesA/MoeB/ThiF family protein n=1 Tax=Spirulina sp. CCY15215 TaxID=2767591 RepID=UPI00194E10D8|nr:ThiF family adenylyltransferase [Spirulina major]
MSNSQPEAVQQHFEREVQGEARFDETLIFDPETGELVVQRRGEIRANPDAVTVDQPAREGFFANLSFAFLYEEQLQKVYQNWQVSGVDQIPAIAFTFDEGEVFHIYTSVPKTHFAGFPVPSTIKFLDRMPTIEESFSIVEEILRIFPNQHESQQVTVVVLLAIENERLQYRVFITQPDGNISEGIIKFIPQYSELYSRSTGLLETLVLEQCKVGIVGLGSGGSTVAVELAKAGVGNFVLIDFDRLELSNVARHVCGIGDLGRYKTKAVRDLLYGKNPYINVKIAELDINNSLEETKNLLKDCDLIVAATDNNRSRFNLNNIAIEYKITTIFGRALTRACGGDVLRVRPFHGPCLSCIFTKEFLETRKEEVSQFRQARDDNPAYVPDDEVKTTIQVGLASDIAPISNMIVKLALLELSRGRESGIQSLEEDCIADFYIWANRRENTYANWPKMEYGSKTPSVLRWYGAKWERNQSCEVCGNQLESIEADDNFFG